MEPVDIVEDQIQPSKAIHQEDILWSYPGWFKFSPQIGVGIIDYLESDVKEMTLSYVIQENFQRDGMEIKQLTIDQKGIKIDANY